MATTLNELHLGKTATIRSVGGEGALRQHFLDMGVIPGAEVTMVKLAPMGDPMELQIHGYELTLRIADAKKIEIDDIRNKETEEDKEARERKSKKTAHPGFGEGGKFHTKEDENPLPAGETITFALAGNQNCGKTTLFNQLTGANQHVGNFPGVTVDRKDGVMKGHEIIVLQNGQELANVNKFDNYLTFESSGRGVFTIIALDEGVRNFVGHLYTLVLGREAEQEGLDAWSEALCNKKSSGVDIGYGFVFSDECKERNLSNEEFVEILYKTFLNRPSIDEEGKEAWVSQLDAGVEQEKVFEGFIYSPEFAHICDAYGIQMGRTSDVPQLAGVLRHYRNQNANVTKFVARCYTQALGREFEPEGLEAWCKVILERSNTPKQVAQNFIFSDEFMDKELNSEEYVKVLYRTFMGREADEAGLAAWVNVLESGREDRAKVLEGFSDSAEFAEILQQFGLR